jgi:hypothetical protein
VSAHQSKSAFDEMGAGGRELERRLALPANSGVIDNNEAAALAAGDDDSETLTVGIIVLRHLSYFRSIR